MDWLDDTDINYFLKVFADSSDDSIMIGETKNPPTHIRTVVCSSFYFESLRIRGMECISQWLESYDLNKIQNILFPLHSDSHWSLCLIHIPSGVSVIFDPLRPAHMMLSNILLNHQLVKIVIYSTACIQQDNTYDCGVYSLYYAGCIIKNRYSQINRPVPSKFKEYIRRKKRKRKERRTSCSDYQ